MTTLNNIKTLKEKMKMTTAEKIIKEFEDKFVGDNNPQGIGFLAWEQIRPFLLSSLRQVAEEAVKACEAERERIAREVEGMKKEMLDKSDPDNYEAIYAIAGFNNALNKVKNLIFVPNERN